MVSIEGFSLFELIINFIIVFSWGVAIIGIIAVLGYSFQKVERTEKRKIDVKGDAYADD